MVPVFTHGVFVHVCLYLKIHACVLHECMLKHVCVDMPVYIRGRTFLGLCLVRVLFLVRVA